MIEYTGRKIERRSKDRKPLTNEFTIKLMRMINEPGKVVMLDLKALKCCGTKASHCAQD